MLFNSYDFLFLFLPAALLAFYAARKFRLHAFSLAIVFGFSLIFYAVWNVRLVWLILASIIINYGLGIALERARVRGGVRKWILAAGICVNLGFLFYFKYVNFFLDTASYLSGIQLAPLPDIVLPIGISFYTFQQIAFLVDAYLGKVREKSFLAYAAFVSFFPQLVAGPIVHHSELVPQFANERRRDIGQRQLDLPGGRNS